MSGSGSVPGPSAIVVSPSNAKDNETGNGLPSKPNTGSGSGENGWTRVEKRKDKKQKKDMQRALVSTKHTPRRLWLTRKVESTS